jgi:hypothetical protein
VQSSASPSYNSHSHSNSQRQRNNALRRNAPHAQPLRAPHSPDRSPLNLTVPMGPSSVPSEIHCLRDVVRRIAASGSVGERETKLLERQLGSLQAGLQEMKLRRAEEQRRVRIALAQKKTRAEARRLQHIESLAQVRTDEEAVCGKGGC